jgi:cytochrome c biogenesis protein CcdA/thiol-disulfide isomerase/thioredoxin
MPTLLFFSLLAGAATVLSPCIWPLLPIVISASSSGGRLRPFAVVLGLTASFSASALGLAYLERSLHLDPGLLRLFAAVVLGLLGLAMLIPWLGARLETGISWLLRPLQGRGLAEGASGLGGGLVAGVSMGLLWAPCAGPILAGVATAAAARAVDLQTTAVTAAYAAGLAVPLLAFAAGGSWLGERARRLSRHTGRVQQVFGAVMIAAAALIYTDYDKVIQLKALELLPGPAAAAQGARPVTTEVLKDLGPAPEFQGITRWLGSPPLTMAALRGKVVLVDFWTYTCINCVRTLPRVEGWYRRYGPQGFIVVGVHAPEFVFEKETGNVERARRRYGLTYPVAQDNDLRTWGAFANHYWPAEYLIDASGRIRLVHAGEGRYDEMEAAIRSLLEESGTRLSAALSPAQAYAAYYGRTPETYLGLDRMERFACAERAAEGRGRYSLPAALPADSFAFAGVWDLRGDRARPAPGAALELSFRADKVFLVIGPERAGAGALVRVLIDGKPAGAAAAGADVRDGTLVLDGQRLYELVDLRGNPGAHRLRLEFKGGAAALYAFTFG